MNIFMISIGTRGDVQPYVALGKGLQAAGHSVTICTSSSFESFITSHGLRYGYMNDELMDLMNSEEGRRAMENTAGIFEAIITGIKLAKTNTAMQRHQLRDGGQAAAAANPDLVIFHPKALGGAHYAEKQGVPCLLAVPFPLYVPTGEYPVFVFPRWKIGAWYNRLTYKLVLKVTSMVTGKYVKEWREANGLSPQPRGTDFVHTTAGESIPVVHAYSEHVLPRPRDWPDHAITTGYWFLDGDEEADEWKPPADLVNFLEAGPPPVYVGFGSIFGSNPRRTAEIVVEAMRIAGVRGILATGWGGLAPDNLPDTIFRIEKAPHDWLFPRMAAVVHHGGAGSTAAGLRAGRPTIICPFFGDQPFWGRTVHELGVGAAPIPQKKLSAEKLAAAIKLVVDDQGIRDRARALGGKIRGEDGIARAIEFIEAFAAQG